MKSRSSSTSPSRSLGWWRFWSRLHRRLTAWLIRRAPQAQEDEALALRLLVVALLGIVVLETVLLILGASGVR